MSPSTPSNGWQRSGHSFINCRLLADRALSIEIKGNKLQVLLDNNQTVGISGPDVAHMLRFMSGYLTNAELLVLSLAETSGLIQEIEKFNAAEAERRSIAALKADEYAQKQQRQGQAGIST
ncbi:hypothetical protein EPO44_10300 [bacterium]|nr:MAG: hypothetical protein EPO44_10300 [bacterium]